MPRKEEVKLSNFELEIMEIVWKLGECSVRERLARRSWTPWAAAAYRSDSPDETPGICHAAIRSTSAAVWRSRR